MRQRTLGRGGPQVGAIGLGCMGMSPAIYGPVNDQDGIRTVHRALDIGVTFLDTAEVYGRGHNEELVGKAIAGRRREVFLATKFGIVRPPGDQWKMQTDGRPATVRRSIEGSLQRLKVDYVDLYYQHRIDLEVPVEDTVGAMALLVREGKVRYLGLSEPNAQTVRRAHAVHPISAVQSELSLWSRDPQENGVMDVLEELGIALVAYSPLGRGFLSGEIKSPDDFAPTDFRRTLPRFAAENFQKNLDLVTRVKIIADAKGVTPAQIALAWVLAQGEMVIPIPGTTKIPRLEENAAAAEISLSEAELRSLDELAGSVAGPRYADMSWVNR